MRMGRKQRLVVALGTLTFAAPLAICQEKAATGKDLPRFHEVAPGLYRGGQPTRAGFEHLKERGVKTVINLRDERDERKLVEELGSSTSTSP